MKLDIYSLYPAENLKIRDAPLKRQWMDETPEKYAYRCLPLNIANQYGWQLLNENRFTATWNGGNRNEDLQIKFDKEDAPFKLAISHFGNGILTFEIPYVIRTEKNYDLMASGPINHIKHGIQALNGIIETDWLEFTFTMNWKFTAPGTVVFEEHEPFCQVFPIEKNLIQKFQPNLLNISQNKELQEENKKWSESRGDFIKKAAEIPYEQYSDTWQKNYFQGVNKSGVKAENHTTKIKLCPIKKVNL